MKIFMDEKKSYFFIKQQNPDLSDYPPCSRQFDEHILKVTLLKSNLLLISSEQIMLLLKDFTAFFFNSCETIHVMNILGGGRSYLEPKGKELSQVFFVVVVVKQLKWS